MIVNVKLLCSNTLLRFLKNLVQHSPKGKIHFHLLSSRTAYFTYEFSDAANSLNLIYPSVSASTARRAYPPLLLWMPSDAAAVMLGFLHWTNHFSLSLKGNVSPWMNPVSTVLKTMLQLDLKANYISELRPWESGLAWQFLLTFSCGLWAQAQASMLLLGTEAWAAGVNSHAGQFFTLSCHPHLALVWCLRALACFDQELQDKVQFIGKKLTVTRGADLNTSFSNG